MNRNPAIINSEPMTILEVIGSLKNIRLIITEIKGSVRVASAIENELGPVWIPLT